MTVNSCVPKSVHDFKIKLDFYALVINSMQELLESKGGRTNRNYGTELDSAFSCQISSVKTFSSCESRILFKNCNVYYLNLLVFAETLRTVTFDMEFQGHILFFDLAH